VSNDKKYEKYIVIGFMAFLFIGIYTAKKYFSSKDSIDKDSKEILDDASDFEKMRAEIVKSRNESPDDLARRIIQRSQKTTTQTTTKTEESSETIIDGSNEEEILEIYCSNIDRALKKCGQSSTPPNEPTDQQSASDETTSPDSSPRSSSQGGSRQYSQADTRSTNNELSDDAKALLAWKSISNSGLEYIEGRQKQHSGKVLKAGCEMLVILQNEIHVVPGIKHTMKLNVRGPLDNCELPKTEGIQFIAEATMTENDKAIIANVITCTDRNPRSKSVDCSKSNGRVMSISGAQLLEGDLYDETGMGIFWETLLSLGMTAPLAQLTETAASAKTIFNSASASSIAATLTKTTDRIAQKISGMFNAKGIRLKPKDGRPIPMIVMFEQDVILN
jgi:hypothetical protein